MIFEEHVKIEPLHNYEQIIIDTSPFKHGQVVNNIDYLHAKYIFMIKDNYAFSKMSYAKIFLCKIYLN
jgi:hypothetical protein